MPVTTTFITVWLEYVTICQWEQHSL